MRGRKPKPTAVKITMGNPGRRPLNAHEPKARVSWRAPSPPRKLNDDAKKEWRRKCALLRTMRVLTDADLDALAMYCVVYARWIEAERIVTQTGLMLKSKSTGQLYTNPMLYIANKAWEQARKMLPEFGMTSSRWARLEVMTADDETLADLLFSETEVPQGGG